MLIEGLYNILALENRVNGAKATVKLNKDHKIFEGHFPGNPIMPGVCMIQIIKEITEEIVAKDLFLANCSNIKFMAIINPNINPVLVLDIEIEEVGELVKIKNTIAIEETIALKMSATFRQNS